MTDLGDGRVYGVYVLYDAQGRVLYVGKGSNRAVDRLRAHRQRPWGRHIRSKTWTPCDSETAALELEARLIRDLSPRYNKQHNLGRHADDHALLPEVGLDPWGPPSWLFTWAPPTVGVAVVLAGLIVKYT